MGKLWETFRDELCGYMRADLPGTLLMLAITIVLVVLSVAGAVVLVTK